GTAAWLTRGDAFKGWRTDGCLLWVHGKPGSGKSILRLVSLTITSTVEFKLHFRPAP
ncbi:hypothetical protein EDB85DRAFT_1936896, partial [Lactarius pseudohatsudake]